ncbi:MAG: hypothetical protein ACE5JD_12065 [Candidatus Methylomirabilia bacterium]
MADRIRTLINRAIGARRASARTIGFRVSPFWLGAAGVLLLIALSAGQASGAEVALSREIAVHGQNLSGLIAQPVSEMKRELGKKGCIQFSLAYWSVNTPTRLRVEVRCAGWIWEMPLETALGVGN